MGLYAGIKNGSDNTHTDVVIPGLGGNIHVYRDEFGVPTIIADTVKDLVFGQGYEFARDRTFQLEFYRSLINGQMSKLIGSDLVETDKVLKTIGLKRAADLMQNKLTPEELEIIQSYVNGINTYYDQHPHNLPVELEILGAKPQHWEVTDTIAMGSIVAFTFAFGGLNNEITRTKIINKLGMDSFLQVFPVDYKPAYDYLKNQTTVYYPDQDSNVSLHLNAMSDSSSAPNFIKVLQKLFGPNADIAQGFMSNNWVVSGNKTKSGHPIIANDPHTSLGAQGIWHRVNLMTTDGQIILQGFNFPGTPLLGFGHNKNLMWAVTSGIMDSVDLFYMKMNATHYLYNGTEWHKFEVIDTPIEVKGEKTIDYKVRKTALGPIISTELGDYVMAWTLNQNFDRDNPIKSLIDFNFAKNIADMHNALRYMLTGFNWVFATNDGHIGYQQSGFIPNRSHGYGLIPKNGSVVNAGWNGLIPYDDQLFVVDPPQGYWATANERVDTRELFYISEVYATRHRNDRIEQVLANGTDSNVDPNAITVQDMEHLQADVKTLVAEDLLEPVLNLFKSYRSQTSSDLTAKVIDLLSNWDQRVTIDSVAALVFETYRIMLGKAVFGDEFGDLFSTYLGFRDLTEWYPQGNKTIKWFDDITTTNKVENSDDMAIKALEQTVTYLSNRYGADLSNWHYGDKHRVTLPHAFHGTLNIFDIGGDPAPGSSLTVNAISGPDYIDGGISYTSSYGPYFRVVAEVEQTWGNIYVVVSSGASQNPLSPHYRDAYKSWLTFDYHKWYSDKSYIESHYELTAVFRSDKR